MPVNVTPKRRPIEPTVEQLEAEEAAQKAAFGEETELDREKDGAEAESKDLWDQTEVIDMDQW
ncbi:MAG: hypothetical protein U0172_01855 [Nitrospiraceae bacterium]